MMYSQYLKTKSLTNSPESKAAYRQHLVETATPEAIASKFAGQTNLKDNPNWNKHTEEQRTKAFEIMTGGDGKWIQDRDVTSPEYKTAAEATRAKVTAAADERQKQVAAEKLAAGNVVNVPTTAPKSDIDLFREKQDQQRSQEKARLLADFTEEKKGAEDYYNDLIKGREDVARREQMAASQGTRVGFLGNANLANLMSAGEYSQVDALVRERGINLGKLEDAYNERLRDVDTATDKAVKAYIDEKKAEMKEKRDFEFKVWQEENDQKYKVAQIEVDQAKLNLEVSKFQQNQDEFIATEARLNEALKQQALSSMSGDALDLFKVSNGKMGMYALKQVFDERGLQLNFNELLAASETAGGKNFINDVLTRNPEALAEWQKMDPATREWVGNMADSEQMLELQKYNAALVMSADLALKRELTTKIEAGQIEKGYELNNKFSQIEPLIAAAADKRMTIAEASAQVFNTLSTEDKKLAINSYTSAVQEDHNFLLTKGQEKARIAKRDVQYLVDTKGNQNMKQMFNDGKYRELGDLPVWTSAERQKIYDYSVWGDFYRSYLTDNEIYLFDDYERILNSVNITDALNTKGASRDGLDPANITQ